MADELTRLKDYPFSINDVEIPFPKSFSDNRGVIENVNQSETGKDIVQLRRVGKREFTYTYRLLSDWIPMFDAWADSETELTVKFYDHGTGEYEEKSMRMRNYSRNLVQHSEDLYGIMGIWDFTFTLIEF